MIREVNIQTSIEDYKKNKNNYGKVALYDDRNRMNEITSTLFGFDYIKQGKKWFGENDDFHIEVEGCFEVDLLGVKGALSNYNDRISSLEEINKLRNKSLVFV